jgi:hypothetical protein
MTKGVLLFANNNGTLNYIKQAEFLAKRIQKYLNLPVSLVTTSDYDNTNNLFDNVIQSTSKNYHNTTKRHHDGDLYNKITTFLNTDRADVYYLTPYDETIVMDTDYVISNDILNNCFLQQKELLLYKDAIHVGIHTGTSEFLRISDTSVDFYWATVFYFKKSEQTKMFFDLVKHIKENYMHYRSMYQFRTTVYRNDFAFSIALHIMNGYKSGDFAGILPGKKFYAIDKDVLLDIVEDEIKILVQKTNRFGEYTAVNLKGSNCHIMNKFSLERIIDNQ